MHYFYIDKKNEIIYLQEVQMYVAENRVVETKENAMNNISRNHKLLEERRIQLRNKLFNKENIPRAFIPDSSL